jgi:hypothetical protein
MFLKHHPVTFQALTQKAEKVGIAGIPLIHMLLHGVANRFRHDHVGISRGRIGQIISSFHAFQIASRWLMGMAATSGLILKASAWCIFTPG